MKHEPDQHSDDLDALMRELDDRPSQKLDARVMQFAREQAERKRRPWLRIAQGLAPLTGLAVLVLAVAVVLRTPESEISFGDQYRAPAPELERSAAPDQSDTVAAPSERAEIRENQPLADDAGEDADAAGFAPTQDGAQRDLGTSKAQSQQRAAAPVQEDRERASQTTASRRQAPTAADKAPDTSGEREALEELDQLMVSGSRVRREASPPAQLEAMPEDVQRLITAMRTAAEDENHEALLRLYERWQAMADTPALPADIREALRAAQRAKD